MVLMSALISVISVQLHSRYRVCRERQGGGGMGEQGQDFTHIGTQPQGTALYYSHYLRLLQPLMGLARCPMATDSGPTRSI